MSQKDAVPSVRASSLRTLAAMASHAPPLAAEAFPQGVAHKALTALAHTNRGVRAAGTKRRSIVSIGAVALLGDLSYPFGYPLAPH